MTGCVNSRWPVSELKIEETAIKQEVKGDTVEIRVYLKETAINSIVEAISKVDEVGDGVIIVKSIKGSPSLLLGNTSGSDRISVKRVKGKKYTLILRDENNKLIRVMDFVIE